VATRKRNTSQIVLNIDPEEFKRHCLDTARQVRAALDRIDPSTLSPGFLEKVIENADRHIREMEEDGRLIAGVHPRPRGLYGPARASRERGPGPPPKRP
jgi:hypothetical protein